MSQEMSRDAWKYTSAPKPGDLKGNRYLNPPKSQESKKSTPAPQVWPKKGKELDFLSAGPIICYDADGNVTEKYNKIDVAMDIPREGEYFVNLQNRRYQEPKRFHMLEAILFYEKQQMFLPSFALNCGIIVWCFNNMGNPAARKLLEQYKDHAFGDETTQNTIVNVEKKVLLHYPHDINTTKVNQNIREISLSFPGSFVTYSTIDKALKKPKNAIALKNLTGLKEPEILTEIAEHFGKKTEIDIHQYDDFRNCWFSLLNRLSISVEQSGLNHGYLPARGVRTKGGRSK